MFVCCSLRLSRGNSNKFYKSMRSSIMQIRFSFLVVMKIVTFINIKQNKFYVSIKNCPFWNIPSLISRTSNYCVEYKTSNLKIQFCAA
jgi:hypothetical protein